MSLSRLPAEVRQNIAGRLSIKSARNLCLAGKGTCVSPSYDQCCMRFSELDAAKLAFTVPLRVLMDVRQVDNVFSRRQVGGKTVFLYLPYGDPAHFHSKTVETVEIIETPGHLIKAWHAHSADYVLVPREMMQIQLMRFVIPILQRRTNCIDPGWVFKCWKSILKDWIAKFSNRDDPMVLISIYGFLLTPEAQIRLNPVLNNLLGLAYLTEYYNFLDRYQQYAHEFELPILAVYELNTAYMLNPISLTDILAFVDMINEDDVRPEFFKPGPIKNSFGQNMIY